MEKMHVHRGLYRRMGQADLLPFSQYLIDRVLQQATYAAVQEPALLFQAQLAKYLQALSLAENQGRDAIAAKNAVKARLLQQLDALVDALEAQADNPLYLTNLGLQLRLPTSRRFNGPPSIPEALRLQPGRLSGEALVLFETVVGARMYAIEWRETDQSGWNNGNYATSRRQLIRVPARREIAVRVCALAAGNQHGPWSEPAMAFIP